MYMGAKQGKQVLRIIVDNRESASEVVGCLECHEGVEISMQHLKVGDYQVAGWLFERKTLLDFSASIVDGRLFSQANRLAGSRTSAAIILEGSGKDLATVGVHRNALQGALITLALIYQIPILRSRSAAETAQLLLFAGHQLCRQPLDTIPRHGRQPKRRRKLQVHILQGLPGVGPRRAVALLDHFGAVRTALNASVPELCFVPGIHRATAEKIHGILD
jgi:DNA excision repair protein ERCC-4